MTNLIDQWSSFDHRIRTLNADKLIKLKVFFNNRRQITLEWNMWKCNSSVETWVELLSPKELLHNEGALRAAKHQVAVCDEHVRERM